MKTFRQFLAEVRDFHDWMSNPNSRKHQPKTNNFTDEEERYIRAYTGHPFSSIDNASSHNINSYLRRRANPNHEELPFDGVDVAEIHQHAMNLAKAWRPETTNTEKIKLYSGIPSSEGERLLRKGAGHEGHLPGFVSGSDNKRTAVSFSDRHMREGGHVLSIVAHPGTAISVGGNTPSYGEAESIVRYGAKYKYHGSEEVGGLTVHKISVHPSFKSIHGYPAYKDHLGREYK